MLVIQKVSTGETLPAENLRWVSVFQNNQYTIHTVQIAFTDVQLPANFEVTASGQRNDLVLGQISKTGRVMPITQQYVNP